MKQYHKTPSNLLITVKIVIEVSNDGQWDVEALGPDAGVLTVVHTARTPRVVVRHTIQQPVQQLNWNKQT